MSPELRLRRLDALSALMKRYASASAPSAVRLGDALDTLLDATAASGAAAYDREILAEPTSERRLRPIDGDFSPALGRALRHCAERSLAISANVRLNDLRLDGAGIEDAGQLIALGATVILAVPLLAEASAEGAFVLLFADSAMLDEETVRYIESVARLTTLALERDRGTDAESQFRDELTETSRMATLGLYTASVAHELRGPSGALVLQQEELKTIIDQLGVLSGSSGNVLSSSVAELTELVSDMGMAVERIRGTVSQLTTIGRRDTGPEVVRLAEVVRESLAIARPQLERRGVVLVEQIDRDCFTTGRRDNLGQVVLNLVLNAADAAQAGSPPRIWVRIEGSPNEVQLIVEDNGPGVPKAQIPHIFKPFFTTKQRGKGTGLGLKICSDVVNSHGGHIEVDDRPGGGARFRVVLLRSPARASAEPPAPSGISHAPGANQRNQRVLVIDDDPIFSRTVRRALRPHDVRTSGSASEAEIALLDPDYDPDLIICDVLLPGTNGNVLHARVSERRPEVAARFVFVTGGGLAKAEADYLRASGCLTLFKPLDMRSLLALLDHGWPDSKSGVRTLSQSDPPGALS